MFGDYAPILRILTQKISSVLYFDDVHGMSWRGKMELVLFLMQ
jgi:hypothetical protein